MQSYRLITTAGAGALALAALAACSTEQPTAPAAARIRPAVYNIAGSLASQGDLIACKTGSAGTFTVVFDAPVDGVRSFDATQVNNTLIPAGTRTYTFGLSAGECKTLYTRPIVGGVDADPNVRAVITEAAGPALLTIDVDDDGSGNEATSSVPARSATLQFNMYHDAKATFNNQAPQTSCTHTIGWYQNQGAGTVPGGEFDDSGKTYAQVLALDPNGNHYYIVARQYIAATLNAAAGAAPTPAVVAAIAQAQAYFLLASPGTPLPAGYTKDALSKLATVLDEFNRGVVGPGKCA